MLKKASKVERQVESLVETLQIHALLVAKMTGEYLADLSSQLAADTLETGAVESLAHAKCLLTLVGADPRAEPTITEARMTRASINRHRHYVFDATENIVGDKQLLDAVEQSLQQAFDRAESIVALTVPSSALARG